MLAGAACHSHAGRASTSAMTRSGWRAAILSAIAAPIEMPPTTNRSTPRESAKASTSSANVAIE